MEETFLISQLALLYPLKTECDTGLKWVNNNMRTYNIGNTITGQGNYYKISCLVDYPYFKKVNKKTREATLF